MINLFITKNDINGNNFYILVDENKREYIKSYNLGPFAQYDNKIKVTKASLKAMEWNLYKQGYKKIER